MLSLCWPSRQRDFISAARFHRRWGRRGAAGRDVLPREALMAPRLSCPANSRFPPGLVVGLLLRWPACRGLCRGRTAPHLPWELPPWGRHVYLLTASSLPASLSDSGPLGVALALRENTQGDIFSVHMRVCRASTINFCLPRTQRSLYFLSEYHGSPHRNSVFRMELPVDPQVRQSLTAVKSGCVTI